MDSTQSEEVLKFFRKKNVCRNICSLYKATENVTSQGVINQSKCPTCKKYLYPAGFSRKSGITICKCCGDTVIYVEKKADSEYSQEIKSIEKKPTPTLSQKDTTTKTYNELVDFIEGIQLKANYQLVMLKFLVNHKIANKGQISEDLAFYNNKDIKNIDEIKKFFNVPVYQVLENKGFVKKIDNYGFSEYMLNVNLNDYESMNINDSLETKIKEYNLQHNIPYNEFGVSSGINWKEDQTYVKDIENEIRLPNLWIWSVTPENWEILKAKNVWGSRIPKERIGQKILSGDQVAFYVIGTNAFKGIFEFVSEWFDSPGKTWDDDIESDGSLRYISQIKINPIQLGSVNVPDLYEKLDLFRGKPQNICNLILQGGSGYPSNNNRPILEDDFEIIKKQLELNQINHESSLQEEKTSQWIVKECPRCHTTIEGLQDIELNNRIEEVFGYRLMDTYDPLSRIPQSYCRTCRKTEKYSKTSSVNQNTFEDQEEKSVEESTTEKTIIKPEQIVVFNSKDGGFSIKRFELQSTDFIQRGDELSNDELMKKFGVGNMGGIRYSRRNNILILCSTLSEHYSDSIDEDTGIIKYTGEGLIGEQSLTAGNYKIANSNNTTMLFFKEKPQEPGAKKRGALDNIYTFVGKVKYLKHYWMNALDRNNQTRRVIKFVLEMET